MTTNPIDTIRSLTDHTDACSTDPLSDDDAHDIASRIARELLCDPALSTDELDADDFDPALLHTLRCAITDALDSTSPTIRTALSMMLLDHSLCPLHFIDYCACFDDDDPECATIRQLFPSHDS